jgi:hypothetical protein
MKPKNGGVVATKKKATGEILNGAALKEKLEKALDDLKKSRDEFTNLKALYHTKVDEYEVRVSKLEAAEKAPTPTKTSDYPQFFLTSDPSTGKLVPVGFEPSEFFFLTGTPRGLYEAASLIKDETIRQKACDVISCAHRDGNKALLARCWSRVVEVLKEQL